MVNYQGGVIFLQGGLIREFSDGLVRGREIPFLAYVSARCLGFLRGAMFGGKDY